ncbi:MAG: endopeptidase La [Gammaproteobacteria bacterium]|nr:endopeptidase La [Gammaproteobacteria bacterium]
MKRKLLSPFTISDQEKLDYPVLPLRDVVIYPDIVVPLFIGRPKSINALEHAVNTNKLILLVAQKDPKNEDPSITDLYSVGIVATILQLLKLPDGNVKVLVEGKERVQVARFLDLPKYIFAELEPKIPTIAEETSEKTTAHRINALSNSAFALFSQFVKLEKKIPDEILPSINDIEDKGKLADTIAVYLPLKLSEKQKILETFDIRKRLEVLIKYLKSHLEVLELQKKISTSVRGQIDKDQQRYYLREQMKVIKKELGKLDEIESMGDELKALEKQIKKSGMPEEAQAKALAELKKLRMMPPMSAESTVSRNYLDWLLQLPWKQKTKINKDLSKAEKILNQDHYGLEKIKERILEYLAVQSRVEKLKGPILCLVGPPGVGKTSLGQSIARATGRKFTRMSLGGVRDEAEIRGHRRTYIGSLPGKIMHNISKVGVKNPLFLLDEVDKMAMDFRGDPSSALLEVLDPEQNATFNDHYLEVDYDLSDVMFVTTANTLEIPPPLLDRMEVIHLSGYTEDEKLNIAKRYLMPKLRKANGLKTGEVKISDGVVRDIIRYYTREAGGRNLEREISKIYRKVVKNILLNPKTKQISVQSKNLEDYLGVRKYHFGKAEEKDQIGQVTGLAWTEVGGELLTIEAATMPGKGTSIITGQLGEVMQESVQAALTVARSRSEKLGIHPKFFEKNDIHVHVPEGAIPKDGPSAGIAMCTALVSVLTGIPVHANFAMTGEITLRGEVLPIGGLKEKLLAARRGGIEHVIIPQENEKDLKEIPKNVQEDLKIHPVRWIDEVWKLALEHLPKPQPKSRQPQKGPKEKR